MKCPQFMKCPQCSEVLILQEEHDYDDFEIEEDGIIGKYICKNTKCQVEDVYIFTPIDATL